MKHHEAHRSARESVVFLHGGNVAGWMWGEQLPAFSRFHTLVPDLPGFGESNAEAWTSVADAADAVAGLIADRAHGGRANIVGLSLGSSIAIALAARHPGAVRSLFLASPTVTPVPRGQRLVGTLMIRAWNRRWFWEGLARSYRLPADSRDVFVETGLGIRQDTARRILDEVGEGMPADLLATVAAPTLAVAGERDAAFVRLDSLRAIAESVPAARTAIAPAMHHQWNIENVDLFNAAALEWIERRTVSASLASGPGPGV